MRSKPEVTRHVDTADIPPGTSYTLQPGEAARWHDALVVQRDGRFEVWLHDVWAGWHLDEVCHGGQWTLHSEALPVVPERPEPVLDKLAWRAHRESLENRLYREDRDPRTRPI